MLDFNDAPPQPAERVRPNDRELEDIRQAVHDNGETIVTYLLGQPNRLLSSKAELRWGTNGSLSFAPAKGVWRDHENDDGGDLLSLIKREQKTDFAGALKWAREFLGVGGIGHKATGSRASKPKALPAPSGHPTDVAFALTKCGPAKGTLVETYLAGRGLELPPCEDVLFAADLAHMPTKRGYPAMVCHIRNAAGESIGIHRTWLADDGNGKAPVTAGKAKMTMKMGDDSLIGAIRLMPMMTDGGMAGALGVAEGIETALAAAKLFGMPVWSCISTAGMKRFEWPDGTEWLVIFADRDEKGAGRRAAEALRERALAAGVKVTIRVAAANDFNDDLRAGIVSTDEEFSEPAIAGEVLPPTDAEAGPVTALSLMEEVAALTPADAGTLPVQLAIAKAVTAGFNELEIEAILQAISKNTRVAIGVLRSFAKKMAAGSARNQVTEDWRKHLDLDEMHVPFRSVPNIVTVLNECPEWRGVIKFDEFSQRIIMRRGAPWMADPDMHPDELWSDETDTAVACWLAQNVNLRVRSVDVYEAVKFVAKQNRIHPVRDYLDSLVWDGVARIDTWLQMIAGVVDTPYVRAVGARWLISGVARIYRPGCKADHALILEGPQGLKKSTLIQIIGCDWYTDDITEMGTKDTNMQCHGNWIIEIPELDAMTKADVSRTKAFISRGTDHFRPPYERTTRDFPRQFIFAGTVNPDNTGYLKDPSGGRRFWPVECTEINKDLAIQFRDQLWAEARVRFENGESWWLHEKELIDAAQTEQEARYEGDPWESKIREYLTSEKTRTSEGGFYLSQRAEPLTETTAADIFEHALIIDVGRWDKAGYMRIGRIMKTLEFVNTKITREGRQVRGYKRIKVA